jgi:hypothetical protein
MGTRGVGGRPPRHIGFLLHNGGTDGLCLSLIYTFIHDPTPPLPHIHPSAATPLTGGGGGGGEERVKDLREEKKLRAGF